MILRSKRFWVDIKLDRKLNRGQALAIGYCKSGKIKLDVQYSMCVQIVPKC